LRAIDAMPDRMPQKRMPQRDTKMSVAPDASGLMYLVCVAV